MRYVNLKKRSNTTLERNTKKVAVIGLFALLFTAILVVPATRQLETANANLKEQNLQFENNAISQDGETINLNLESF